MTLSQDLQWRNLIKDHTFADISWLDEPRTFYLGADANSADSLTIGNLAIFMVARRLAAAGWKPILLVGGATSLVGDPGGKTSERDLTVKEQVEHNIAGVKAQVERLVVNDNLQIVNNYDWFKNINFLDFLRDAGKHYSMTELLQRDYISERLGEGGSGISYAEFSYSLIQGYDYYHLNQEYGVELQIGGSDQWGNMLSGVPFIRKKNGREVHAFSMPLVIDKVTGRKFGKSEGGAIWLDPSKTTVAAFYQFWINVDDAGVEDYLKVYTEYDKSEIEAIMAQHNPDKAARYAQKRLAAAVTALVHGDEQMATAVRVTALLTGDIALSEANDAEMTLLRQEIPTANGTDLVSILVEGGLAASNGEARRLIAANGVSLNGQKAIADQVPAEAFVAGRLLVRKGKKFRDSILVES